MGRIKKGILGGFSGKVGTVVGGNVNGISYMRSLPHKVRNPRTVGQLSQRTKFALVGRMVRMLSPLLHVGWKLQAGEQSAINAAMSYTLANAITGTYPDYAIDPSKVMVSCGALTPAYGAVVDFGEGKIKFAWESNIGIGKAKETDKALIAIVNSSKGAAITKEGAERHTEAEAVAIPAAWAGDTVDVYLGFVSADGEEVADSVYLGEVPV